MKNIYQKPNFKFVPLLLETNPGAACHYSATYEWEVCPVDVKFVGNIFNSDDCDTDFDGYSICQYTGPANSSVFGS